MEGERAGSGRGGEGEQSCKNAIQGARCLRIYLHISISRNWLPELSVGLPHWRSQLGERFCVAGRWACPEDAAVPGEMHKHSLHFDGVSMQGNPLRQNLGLRSRRPSPLGGHAGH